VNNLFNPRDEVYYVGTGGDIHRGIVHRITKRGEVIAEVEDGEQIYYKSQGRFAPRRRYSLKNPLTKAEAFALRLRGGHEIATLAHEESEWRRSFPIVRRTA